MLIACDADGVICDLHKKWISVYCEEYGDKLTVNDWNDWDILRIIKPECGEKFFRYVDDPRFYTDPPLEVIDGAKEGIEKLREKHRVVFVTSCSSRGMAQSKLEWMFRFGFLKEPEYKGIKDFIICHDKSLIKADCLIDDRPDNLHSFSKQILFDRPWNRKEYSDKWYRAINWFSVLNIINSWENA